MDVWVRFCDGKCMRCQSLSHAVTSQGDCHPALLKARKGKPTLFLWLLLVWMASRPQSVVSIFTYDDVLSLQDKFSHHMDAENAHKPGITEPEVCYFLSIICSIPFSS